MKYMLWLKIEIVCDHFEITGEINSSCCIIYEKIVHNDNIFSKKSKTHQNLGSGDLV